MAILGRVKEKKKSANIRHNGVPNIAYFAYDGLVWPAAPGIKFDSKPPSLQEVIAVVNKARDKSAPGPNGVPYLLYKRCPNVLKKLHKFLRSAWKNIKISKEWMTAEGVYIPKEQDSRGINQFRPISLLNVEVKCSSQSWRHPY
ncbi:polyprotein [Plakobranchus ocellatus]|uniref:Polyprotein n=1 Tax=Plakobranchus ocellatus TaxID=259542 RepID=A0AAV3Y1I9_9GAST|nr:polyprotein [Plakobranchus ocellatus]